MEDRQDGSLSASELQAELDTLRSLRRRSISQPSDGIDPDLPPASAAPSSSSTAASRSRSASPPSPAHGSLPPLSSNAETSSSLTRSASGASTSAHRLDAYKLLNGEGYKTNDDAPLVGPFINDGNDDMGDDHPISDLFWLPARLHPEIAPQEFKNFIKDQTRPENLMRRSGSMLGRKKSMLSRQYQPSDGETESDSDAASSPPTSRGPSRAGSFRRNTGLERLTLADLQKLEQLARQAAEDGEEGAEGEAGLKSMIRRSLSLNPAALLGAADRLHDEDKPYIDDPDAPLIAPTPGSIIRRTARTKIRKNSLLGESSGGSGERARFGSKRGHRLSPLAASLTPPRDPNDQRTNDGSRKVSTSSLASIASSTGNLADEDTSFDSSKRRSSSAENEGEPEGEYAQTQESPERPARSPKRYALPPMALQSPPESDSAIVSEPLPVQYLSPIPVHGQHRVDDLAPQVDAQHTLSTTPARAGADLPPLQDSVSPPRLASLQVTQGSPADSSGVPPAGSLRTTRKPGRATSPTNASSTGVSATPSIPLPEVVAPVQQAAPETMRPTPASEVKPALPSKVTNDSQAKPPQSTVAQPAPAAAPGPATLHQDLRKPISQQQETSRPPQLARPPAHAPPPAVQSVHLPAPVANRPAPTTKEKDAASASNSKKSTWARLGLSRGSSGKEESGTDTDDAASVHSVASNTSAGKDSQKGKKNKKEKEKAEIVPAPSPSPAIEKEKEKESSGGGGFFGGLFGKKKGDSTHDEKAGHGGAGQHHGPGQGHLSLPTPPPTASGMLTPDGRYVNFYRLPIHIERAVYRLSHIKLANPRRPLYEQVLISNLMFWYLGVINKPTGPPPAMRQPQHQQQNQQRPSTQQSQQMPSAASPAQMPGQAYHHGGNGQSAAHPPTRPGLVRENSTPSAPEAMINDDSPYEATAMEEPNHERPLSSPAAIGAIAEPTYPNSAAHAHRPSSHPPAMYAAPEGLAGRSSPPLEAASMSPGTNVRSGKHAGSGPALESPRPPHLNTAVQQEMGEGRPTTLSTRRSPTEAGFVVTRRDRSSSSSSISRYDDEKADATASGASGPDGSGSQRRTSEFDSYDIISAYEYEERRKSQLAELSTSRGGSPPPMDVQTIINSTLGDGKTRQSRSPPTSPTKNHGLPSPQQQQHGLPFATGAQVHDPSRARSPQPTRS